jgi:hypothetical protein
MQTPCRPLHFMPMLCTPMLCAPTPHTEIFFVNSSDCTVYAEICREMHVEATGYPKGNGKLERVVSDTWNTLGYAKRKVDTLWNHIYWASFIDRFSAIVWRCQLKNKGNRSAFCLKCVCSISSKRNYFIIVFFYKSHIRNGFFSQNHICATGREKLPANRKQREPLSVLPKM